MASKGIARPNYAEEKEWIRSFYRDFRDSSDNAKYIERFFSISNRQSRDFVIELDDIQHFFQDDDKRKDFSDRIQGNALRYTRLFATVADEEIPESKVSNISDMDPSDIWNAHREETWNNRFSQYEEKNAEEELKKIKDKVPKELTRRYDLRIIPKSSEKSMKMREIRAAHVGHLVSLCGIITRVSDVQPLVKVVTYICSVCGYESYQTINDKQYMPVALCPSEACAANQAKGRLTVQTRGSKFVRFQLVKLQETPREVPVGHVPRSITLRVYGDLTRKCKPGDEIKASGIFLPAPHSGFRAMRAGLTAETYIEVSDIQVFKKTYRDTQISTEMQAEINEKKNSPNVFDELAASIAPEIYGHEQIKKALLLLLAGGVTKTMNDGMKIRGDINVLLLGDPGVAKSQLLKHIANIAPSAVYTTGKGSSGVGLTAAVLRDPVTGDMTLEGGALVLADMGICCIDEFDKMEESDRTAIHEVMEQQTVSIAKAGITTTLNARTSILAAANPVTGRWKKGRSLEENVGLPTALLSRFDLQFIILDTPNVDNDQRLAEHVTFVHRQNKAPRRGDAATTLTPAFLRAYISQARHYEPTIPADAELINSIVGNYVEMRSKGAQEGALRERSFSSQTNTRTSFCTARTLLSILRLAQAHARLHFRNEIILDDVTQAIDLLDFSRRALDEQANRRSNNDPISEIYSMITDMAASRNTDILNVSELSDRVIKRGFTRHNLDETINEYEGIGLLIREGGRLRITEGAH